MHTEPVNAAFSLLHFVNVICVILLHSTTCTEDPTIYLLPEGAAGPGHCSHSDIPQLCAVPAAAAAHYHVSLWNHGLLFLWLR